MLMFTLLLLMTAAPAEVVDRTIAVVNHRLLTWSDLDEQMRFEALENGRAPREMGESERRAAFDHLLQDRMLRDQMQTAAPATETEIGARIVEIRAGWKLEKDDDGWAATLARYGMTAEELRHMVARQIEVLNFVTFRVRPLVRVSRADVEEYYSNVLTPQVIARGQKPEPLSDISAKIRELLTEQKMTAEMEKWLANLRAQSSVQILWIGVQEGKEKP
jgi:hypothetical protein